MELALIDKNGVELSNYKLGFGSKLLVKDKAKVKQGTKLYEWDPFTMPIITEKPGVAKFC